MAWWDRRRRGASRTITTAARRVDAGGQKQTGANTPQRSNRAAGLGWQEEAWAYYDALGEVKYAARYVGKAIGKLRPYPAIVPDADQGDVPIPVDEYGLDDAGDDTAGARPIPPDLLQAAQEEVARVRDEHGGTGQILQTLGINLFVAGEGYLVGLPEQTDMVDGQTVTTPEQWAAHSVSEIQESKSGQAGTFELKKGAGSGAGEPLPEGTEVVRVWRPHPKFTEQPDSSLRGVLDDCDELLLLKRSIRATAQSRLAGAGITVFAQEISFGPADPTKDGSSAAEDAGDPLTSEVMAAMITPVSDAQSAAAFAPIMFRVPADMIKDKSWHDHVTYSRDFDKTAIELRGELRGSLATGLDIPPEVLTGKADANHWTAWQIDEDTFKGHVEPDGQLIFDAWTVAIFRPNLKALFPDHRYDELIDKFVVWYDATALVVRPNRVQDAQSAFDRYAISWDAYRQATGFNDGDAPSEDEINLRAQIKAAERGKPEETPADAGDDSVVGPPADTGPPAAATPSQAQRAERLALAAAAAGPGGLEHLGARLHRIDADLRSRLAAGADSAMRRAMTRAGIRVKSKLSGGGPNGNRHGAALAAIRDVRPELVCSTLGRPLLTAAGVDDETLLTDALTEFADQFEKWVSEAQRKVRALLTDALALTPAAVTTMTQRHDADRAAAWAALQDDFEDAAQERIYNPDPTPGPGEFSGVLVSLGAIRAAMNRAGGAESAEGAGGLDAAGRPVLAGEPPALGLANGATTQAALTDNDVTASGYEWVYGISTQGFPPHEDLDGAQFEAFDDDVLVNNADFPETDFLFPGDHDGCACDIVPSWVAAADARPAFNPTGEPLDEAAAARRTA